MSNIHSKLSPTSVTPAQRVDLYGPIHRALRHAMAGMAIRLGTVDPSDEDEVLAAVDDLAGLLCFCERHIEHEEHFMHPLLRGIAPEAEAGLDEAHRVHDASVAELRGLSEAVTERRGAARAETLRALYLAFGRFHAETLMHMDEEERVIEPLFHRHLSGEEVAAIVPRIMGSMGPEEVIETLRMMVPANPLSVRVGMLAEIRDTAPPEAFADLLGICLAALSDRDARRLVDALEESAAA